MKFSLIVPFCNSKDYLPTCLDSLLAQSYLKRHPRSVEIILIDNNSADGSAETASHYARQSARKYNHLIKIHRCSTWGAAAARNLGLRVAKGDYVWCIDSDDWIEPTALAELSAKLNELKAAGMEPDVITMGATKDYDVDVQSHGATELKSVGKGQKNWRDRFVMFGFGPWGYLARRKWLLVHDLFFDEGIIHEDIALISSFILHTDQVYPLDACLYHYVQHAQSVLHRKQWNPHALDIFTALENLHHRFDGYHSRYHDALEYFFIWNLLLDSVRNFKQFEEGWPEFRHIRQMLRKYYPHWRKNRYFRQRSLRFRIRMRLNYWVII